MTTPQHFEERSPWTERIQVGGFNAFSTVDWPGRIVAVVFLRGCPWRCGYCHNPELQTRLGPAPMNWQDVEVQLERRRGFLDGVVFSGGEPTADRCLPDAVARVRGMGFEVGLHTGGAYPERLAALLPELAWVGFDFKSDPPDYEAITHVPGSGARAWASAQTLAASDVSHEFRMTFHPGLLAEETVLRAAQRAASLGVRHFALQAFRPDGCADASLGGAVDIPAGLAERISPLFERFTVRRAY
ncbi:anaerobic ribonucleoside-triphosphate reductase activating protein [Niveibacterium terrae]|uniref:anaerobic ribonucleoside-triphosphate reductase activating protein n=1 Tax=Niveibacterium terrae TaxID=3373598 RepID=UPI003A913FD7